jgi:acyl-CoA reductase-like NAD-dependent aldehyde dehydrogenase
MKFIERLKLVYREAIELANDSDYGLEAVDN